MGIFKFANGTIRVKDLEKSIEFYRDVIGMHELAREKGVVYFGCGADETFDIAIKEGGTGVEQFALQVADEEDIQYYEKKLTNLGISTQRMSNPEPGKKVALRFAAPSGHQLELALMEDRPHYLHPVAGHKGSRGIGILDADHITLHTKDVKGLAEFLQEALDFRVADVFEPAPGVWGAAWTHASDYHHDVALIGTSEDTTLHHFAFLVSGFEDMKRACDLLAQAGYKIETGPGRHGVGGNLFTYFLDPSGNRIELSAEMPRADRSVPHKVWPDFPPAFSTWGALPPESFAKGS
ncbi:catechol 2,3-dioxygenase [Geobacillus genomosp. 3]|nr:VOC family protein [Geobacillus genomosp. 3]AGT32689.1 catechol 2,3-dioxygenase [Geobacillus genomosp. 3]